MQQGQALLEVAALSKVLVEADVYEQHLPSVKLGDRVEITAAALPNRPFTGTASFIVPVLEEPRARARAYRARQPRPRAEPTCT